jgi:exodeoxyribonuclease-3
MTTVVQTEHRRVRARPRARGHERRPVAAATLSVLTFNIAAAAQPRADAILRWLRSRSDDVIVLTETSGGPGTELLVEGLRAAGFAIRHTRDPSERGVLLASRIPIARDLSEEVAVTLPCRAPAVVLETTPRKLALVGVYIPSRDRSEVKVARKEAFIASLLASLRKLPAVQRNRLVLAGDYNVVAPHHEPPLPGFFPWEYGLHDELEKIGLRPAHELRPRGGHPHSWIGRTGTGYLYDYVHVGRGLHRSVERCEYLHGPRQRRLSDHAAVAVRVRLD